MGANGPPPDGLRAWDLRAANNPPPPPRWTWGIDEAGKVVTTPPPSRECTDSLWLILAVWLGFC